MEGRWVQLEPFTNMEQILDVVGLTEPAMRTMVLAIKPEIVLSPAGGGRWSYTMETPRSTRQVTFSHGEEVDYVSVVGKPVKSTMLIEGDSILKEIHNDPGDPSKQTVITRHFDGDVMAVTIEVCGVVSTGKYKRA